MEPPDLVKIAKAIQRLDDMCREAQQLRTDLARIAVASLPWPELQLVPRDAGSPRRTDGSGSR